MVSFFVEEPILLIGTLLAIGFTGSFFLKKFGVPHIVTYMLTGFIFANTVLVEINFYLEFENLFRLVETVALGLIGFKIGTELKLKYLRRDPRTISLLLIGEVGGAFLIAFLAILFFTGNFLIAILLGGLATATDPAGTIEMFRKLKAKGPLTQQIQWLLAFDDVVAVAFVEAILVVVIVSFGGDSGILDFGLAFFREVGIAILIGIVVGFALDLLVERMKDDLEMMELTLGALVLAMGLSHFFKTSVIVTAMVMGITVTNKGGDNYEKAGDLLEIIMSPIIMLFFILIGARVSIINLTPFPLIAIIYIIARSIGKLGGIYVGGTQTPLEPKIKNNLGFGLLAQGGVVLGLVSIADDIFVEAGVAEIGALLVTTIIIATIISEIIGSYGTKFAVTRAGEVGAVESEIELHSRFVHEIDYEDSIDPE